MKLKRVIAIVAALSLILFAPSCKREDTTNEEGDFESSVKILSESMSIDREGAVDVLEIVCSLGLDAKIDNISIATDNEGKTYYKIWFGLNLLSVYMEDGKVDKVLKYGEVVFPKTNIDNVVFPDEHSISLVSLTSPIKAGESATIEILGSPDTEYQIIVKYSSGASTAKGLEPKTSDSEGRVSWTWKVSANVKAGEYSIEIRSEDTSYKTNFTVE